MRGGTTTTDSLPHLLFVRISALDDMIDRRNNAAAQVGVESPLAFVPDLGLLNRSLPSLGRTHRMGIAGAI